MNYLKRIISFRKKILNFTFSISYQFPTLPTHHLLHNFFSLSQTIILSLTKSILGPIESRLRHLHIRWFAIRVTESTQEEKENHLKVKSDPFPRLKHTSPTLSEMIY